MLLNSKAHNDEVEQRVKLTQSFKETTEYKLEAMKRAFEDDLKLMKDESRDSYVKCTESIRRLNDGLNLTEKKSEERTRQLEKVTSAEIKSRYLY